MLVLCFGYFWNFWSRVVFRGFGFRCLIFVFGWLLDLFVFCYFRVFGFGVFNFCDLGGFEVFGLYKLEFCDFGCVWEFL